MVLPRPLQGQQKIRHTREAILLFILAAVSVSAEKSSFAPLKCLSVALALKDFNVVSPSAFFWALLSS